MSASLGAAWLAGCATDTPVVDAAVAVGLGADCVAGCGAGVAVCATAGVGVGCGEAGWDAIGGAVAPVEVEEAEPDPAGRPNARFWAICVSDNETGGCEAGDGIMVGL